MRAINLFTLLFLSSYNLHSQGNLIIVTNDGDTIAYDKIKNKRDSIEIRFNKKKSRIHLNNINFLTNGMSETLYYRDNPDNIGEIIVLDRVVPGPVRCYIRSVTKSGPSSYSPNGYVGTYYITEYVYLESDDLGLKKVYEGSNTLIKSPQQKYLSTFRQYFGGNQSLKNMISSETNKSVENIVEFVHRYNSSLYETSTNYCSEKKSAQFTIYRRNDREVNKPLAFFINNEKKIYRLPKNSRVTLTRDNCIMKLCFEDGMCYLIEPSPFNKKYYLISLKKGKRSISKLEKIGKKDAEAQIFKY